MLVIKLQMIGNVEVDVERSLDLRFDLAWLHSIQPKNFLDNIEGQELSEPLHVDFESNFVDHKHQLVHWRLDLLRSLHIPPLLIL